MAYIAIKFIIFFNSARQRFLLTKLHRFKQLQSI
ncbi:hypothetical protein Y888_08980 [Mixta calida B021323]|nr:hypothetical protein Y888_08980 [Mixta calida B021323]